MKVNWMSDKVVGVLLAGGLARRLGGGDKGLKTLAGKSILSIIIERVAPQVDQLILNANGDAGRFADYKLPVVADVIPDFAGPLAGVLTGLEWVRDNRPDVKWMVSLPTDAPFIPLALVERLTGAIKDDVQMACAKSAGRTHPVVGIWPVSLIDDLKHAMVVENIRKVDQWTGRYKIVSVEFATDPIDPFFNANRIEDFDEAERLYQQINTNL